MGDARHVPEIADGGNVPRQAELSTITLSRSFTRKKPLIPVHLPRQPLRIQALHGGLFLIPLLPESGSSHGQP